MGNRKAKRIKSIRGMEQILIDLKPHRCHSFVYSHIDFDVTKLVDYVQKRKEEGSDLTYFHTFVAALGKTIYNRPRLNRFVQNRHIFEHDDIVISFVAKVSFEDKAEEIMIMVPIKDSDNIDTVSSFIKEKVGNVRQRNAKKEGANSAIDTLGKLPNIIRVPLVGILKWLDNKGMLPASLIEDNLYYSSTIVSNIGSLKTNAIHHNIANFGTCSSLVTMGEIKTVEIFDKRGKKVQRKICDWGIAFDERVADGFYLIRSMEYLQYFFDHPELLETRIDEIVDVPKR